jgi:hypothetical protein
MQYGHPVCQVGLEKIPNVYNIGLANIICIIFYTDIIGVYAILVQEIKERALKRGINTPLID